jgi:hypothetical protein
LPPRRPVEPAAVLLGELHRWEPWVESDAIVEIDDARNRLSVPLCSAERGRPMSAGWPSEPSVASEGSTDSRCFGEFIGCDQFSASPTGGTWRTPRPHDRKAVRTGRLKPAVAIHRRAIHATALELSETPLRPDPTHLCVPKLSDPRWSHWRIRGRRSTVTLRPPRGVPLPSQLLLNGVQTYCGAIRCPRAGQSMVLYVRPSVICDAPEGCLAELWSPLR